MLERIMELFNGKQTRRFDLNNMGLFSGKHSKRLDPEKLITKVISSFIKRRR